MRMDRRKDGQTDGQTDMTKLTVAFRNFANVPKNVEKYTCCPFLYILEQIFPTSSQPSRHSNQARPVTC
jgi:hypothetical protein